jgi:hypothetical protein
VEGAKVPTQDAQYWLERAEDAKRVADQMTHPPTKREMLQIATGYRLLALRALELMRKRA